MFRHALTSCMVFVVLGSAAWSEEIAVDEALPQAIEPGNSAIARVGRFDASDPAAMKFTWPATEIRVRFSGSALNVKLADSGGADRFQIVTDGKPTAVLTAKKGTHAYRVVVDLPPGDHTVSIYKCTESFVGVTTFSGIELEANGKLLPAQPRKHRIEVIGDSISAGYGDEATDQKVHFTPATENAYLTYGATAARAFDADFFCIAWSGRKLWPDNTIPAIYDRTLPGDAKSKWDFDSYRPEVILINLATNDFGKKNPEEEGWVKAYNDFLDHLHTINPDATIYLAIGPMLSDQWSASKSALSTVRKYITRVVADREGKGDKKVHLLEFKMQTWQNGFGADWHPSQKTHKLMAADFVHAIEQDLKWAPVKTDDK